MFADWTKLWRRSCKPSYSGVRGGRPRVRLHVALELMQPVYLMAWWLTHLRQYGAGGAETHLRNNGLQRLIPWWRLVKPYRRATTTWGTWEIVSARRWREQAVWQAARRVVGHLLGIEPRTLRRRWIEQDHLGDRLAWGDERLKTVSESVPTGALPTGDFPKPRP